ncbi:MAG: prephenate dehydratase [Bacteroidetes bacterium]|nr:prephenate dehydratase [Bacteroidota bacterium]
MRNHFIAIQGSLSSFHDLAARKYFGEDVSVLQCGSFREVCERICNNECDYGIIAIENKVAGSILLNYQLIELFKLNVIGEVFVPVELHLLGPAGMKMSEVKEILSHPVALGQSQLFLSKLRNVVINEYKDTATCASMVAGGLQNGLAVIAGSAVAQKFGLEIISPNICDTELNYTRFYILSKGQDYPENPNKASVTIRTAHTPGSLAGALSCLASHSLNVTKIQSVPVPGHIHEYSFHLDIEFTNKACLENGLLELKSCTKSVHLHGMYRSATPH